MSYQLRIDEINEAMQRAKMPEVNHYTAVIERLGTVMAKSLATKIGVDCGDVTYDCGFFGAPFFPVTDGQPLPDELKNLDDEECWGEE